MQQKIRHELQGNESCIAFVPVKFEPEIGILLFLFRLNETTLSVFSFDMADSVIGFAESAPAGKMTGRKTVFPMETHDFPGIFRNIFLSFPHHQRPERICLLKTELGSIIPVQFERQNLET